MRTSQLTRKSVGSSSAILTVNELCRYLGLGRATTYKLLSNGAIPRRKLGKRYVIPRSAIDEWLKSTPCKQEPALPWTPPAKRHLKKKPSGNTPAKGGK